MRTPEQSQIIMSIDTTAITAAVQAGIANAIASMTDKQTARQQHMLLSVPETAELMSLGVSSVRELCHREDFPTVRIGERVLISYDGLKDWIARQVGRS